MAEAQGIVVEIDTSQLDAWGQVLGEVSAKMADRVIMRTLNWVGDKMRTQVVRATAQQAGVPYGRVRSAIDTTRATPTRAVYELHAEGGYLTFAHFHPVQVRAGVRARPWGESRVFPGAFIVRKLPPLAFIRAGAGIRPLYGPSIANEMVRPEPHGTVPSVATFTVNAELTDRLRHEFTNLLRQEAAKRGLSAK